MDTIIKAPRHFRLYGAALAMAALLLIMLAVAMTAGPTMAMEPKPCSEESTPDADTAEVIDSGYYAVFDTFWDYEVGHLSNNFCPPGVTQTTRTDTDEETGEETQVTETTRTGANIHIKKRSSPSPTATRPRSLTAGPRPTTATPTTFPAPP